MNQARILTTSMALVLMVGACSGQPVASPSVVSAPSTGEATRSAAVTSTSPEGAATPSATIHPTALSRRIVFSTYDDVWIVNADGTDLRRLTRSPWHEFDPSLSPDGRLIAYRSEPNDYPELWLMNADGTGQHQLTGDGGFPVWSPDGSMIAYAPGGSPSGESWIAIMNPDGSGQRRLPGTDYGEYPSWSPDGRRIAFSSNLSGQALMSIVDVDGSRVVDLSSVGEGGKVACDEAQCRWACGLHPDRLPGPADGLVHPAALRRPGVSPRRCRTSRGRPVDTSAA